MNLSSGIAVCWLRRDLRLDDHAALFHALSSGLSVLPVFIFDRNILDRLIDKNDSRLWFIHQTLMNLRHELRAMGSDILLLYGKPEECWQILIKDYEVKAVYFNHDYEPYARKRDGEITGLLTSKGIPVHTFKDQVIFECGEVVKQDGTPYTVFTPYSRRWKERLQQQPAVSFSCKPMYDHFLRHEAFADLSAESMGFGEGRYQIPEKLIRGNIIANYDRSRNFPAVDGTSKLGIHLRFGTLSVRMLLNFALSRNETFVNELIWRDFYQMILWHFPHVAEGSFRKEYDNIKWRNDESEFRFWCEGKTGYPLVDAGMRELSSTGYMHNRVRMVTASFLTKHLLIDWKWGEAWFAEKLLDFDLASNNGGWQWAAGCGTDAAPYFRVFNPAAQAEKFDQKSEYIRKWVPEWGTSLYPGPIVDHAFARERVLRVYKEALARP